MSKFMRLIILAIIVISGCSIKPSNNQGTHEVTPIPSATEISIPPATETPIQEQIKITVEEAAVIFTVKYEFRQEDMDIGFNSETGYIVISWTNPSGGMGAIFYLDPNNGDVYDWQMKKINNILDDIHNLRSGAITTSPTEITPTPTPTPTPSDLFLDENHPLTNLIKPPKEGNIQEYKTYTSDEIKNAIGNKHKEIKESILLDTKYWITQCNNANTPRNHAIAALYYSIATRFIPEENDDLFWYTASIPINSIRGMAMSSNMTNDFIKVVAIAQPLDDKYQDYYDVINEIRGRNDEVEFLKGLKDIANSEGYFAVDIYAEDMLELDRKLLINGIKFYETTSMDVVERYDNLDQMPDSNNLKAYLEKYNREINYGDELKNREWNLFLFKKRDTIPAIIEVRLRTYGPKVGGLPLY